MQLIVSGVANNYAYEHSKFPWYVVAIVTLHSLSEVGLWAVWVSMVVSIICSCIRSCSTHCKRLTYVLIRITPESALLKP